MITPQKMLDMIQKYNNLYFNDEIKSDFIINLDKRISSYARCHPPISHVIKIDINPKLIFLNHAIVENTLIHELIHAWQFENGYNKEENGMHGDSFNKWCAYLKDRAGINIAETATDEEQKKFDQEHSCYFIFDGDWGFFVKTLYDKEVTKLKNKGFSIYFIKNPIMKWVKYNGYTDPHPYGPNKRTDSYKKEFILSPLKFDINDINPHACYKLKHFNSNKLIEI